MKFSSIPFSLAAAFILIGSLPGLADNAAAREPVPGGITKPATPVPTYLHDVLPIVMGRCARCHGEPDRILPDFMDYDTAFKRRLELKRRVWESWSGSYYKQPMPPGNGFEAQSMTAEERGIIKHWVEAGAPRGGATDEGTLRPKAERIAAGKKLFEAVCAACHQPTGQGIPGRFPPLAASDYLNADKNRAIQVLVNGLEGAVTVNGQTITNTMPRLPLANEDIANVLTYVYGSMHNSGKEVSAADVGAVRGRGSAPAVQPKQFAPSNGMSPFE